MFAHRLSVVVIACGLVRAQTSSVPLTDRERMLLDRIEKLEARIAALEAGRSPANSAPATPVPAAPAQVVPAGPTPSVPEKPPFSFADGTTLNVNFDGYFGYNFDHPAGRVNLLRANDVTSNGLNLNQLGFIIERTPEVASNRRLGFRFDLMFGQNTETLQGSTANEPRPQVYRNIFQAYGSYLLPLGSGLQIDFGKFASSLGYEGNYTKDQLNYSRSFYFNFLPFYHQGLRATYNVNPKLTLQYWLVNGVNQTEEFNGFKSQAAIINIKPNKNISWNLNYYVGREQRDVVPLLNPGLPSLPTQPGLSTTLVGVRHDGRFHVLDTYASFNLGSKWAAVLEGDYVINRVAANSPPARVYGGVGYLHRQLTSSLALNGRFTYMKDRGGLFSRLSQDLKDVTVTAVYQPLNGFQTRLEYRRDFSNQPFFLTADPSVLRQAQSTTTLGLLWWFGGKEGAW